MSLAEGSFIAGIVVGGALVWLVMTVLRSDHGAGEYAWMLGRSCRARKFECYDWQPGYIVAVSWKGAVRFRNLEGTEGFWVEKARVKHNVRFIGEGGPRWSRM